MAKKKRSNQKKYIEAARKKTQKQTQKKTPQSTQKQKEKTVSADSDSRKQVQTKKSESTFKSTVNYQKSLFDKYIGRWGVLTVIVLVLTIGGFAYKDYLTLEYTYYFKDIGSDMLNTKFPMVNRTKNPQQGSYGMEKRTWSFYEGMGQNRFSGYKINPIEVVFKKIQTQVKSFYPKGDYNKAGKFPGYFFTYILFSAIFIYLYFRTISVNRYSSIIGALLFAFLGYMTLGGTWGHTLRPFKVAFLLFAFEQYYVKKRWYFLPFAIMNISKNAFHLYMYGGVFLGIYFLFRYFSENQFNIKRIGKHVGILIGTGALGISFNAVNIVSRYIRQFGSARVMGNSSFMGSLGKAGIFNIENSVVSEKLTAFFRLFSNDILGNGSDYMGWYNYLEAPVFYCGLLTLLVLPQVFMFLSKRKKIVYSAFLGFWLLVVIIPFLRHAIQGFVGNYYKITIDIFIPFAIIFAGINSLHYISNRDKLNIKLLAGTLVLFLVGLYYPYFSDYTNPVSQNVRLVVTVFLISHSIVLLLFRYPKIRFYVQITLLVLLAAELGYFTWYSVNMRDSYSLEEIKANAGGYDDGSIDAVNYLRSIDKGFYRVEKNYASGTSEHRSLNDAQVQGYYGTSCYSSFNQRNYIRFLEGTTIIQTGKETQTRWAPGVTRRPILQALVSVKYYLSRSQQNRYIVANMAEKINTVKNIDVLRSNYYLPLGFTYDQYITRSDYELIKKGFLEKQKYFNQLQAFYQKQIQLKNNAQLNKKQLNELRNRLGRLNQQLVVPQIDIMMLRGVVLDEHETYFDEFSEGLRQLELKDTIPDFNLNTYRQFVNARKEDTLNIQKQSMNYFEGTIEVDHPRILFFSIPYDTGWQAKVDGESVSVERVNIGLCGIKLQPGSHQVILEYIPPYYNASLALTKGSFALFFILVIMFYRKELRRTPEIVRKKFDELKNLQERIVRK